MDLNKNGINDYAETKSFLKDSINWIKTNKVLSIVSIALVLSLYANTQKQTVYQEVEKIKEVPKNNILSLNGKYLAIDLNDMYTIKQFIKTINKEEKFRVARGIDLGQGTSIYITIDEPITKLDYNIKAFAEQVKKESKGKK